MIYNWKTVELLKRSEVIINRGRMISELCDIQCKKVEELREQSEKFIKPQKKFSEEAVEDLP